MMRYAYRLLAVLMCLAPATRISANTQDSPIDDDVRVTRFVDLAYPFYPQTVAMQGVVVVRVTLDLQGNVVDASALSGAPPLIEAVLPNVRQWKFQPNGHKAAVIVYAFHVDQGGVCTEFTRSLFRLVHFNYATITACGPILRGKSLSSPLSHEEQPVRPPAAADVVPVSGFVGP